MMSTWKRISMISDETRRYINYIVLAVLVELTVRDCLIFPIAKNRFQGKSGLSPIVWEQKRILWLSQDIRFRLLHRERGARIPDHSAMKILDARSMELVTTQTMLACCENCLVT